MLTRRDLLLAGVVAVAGVGSASAARAAFHGPRERSIFLHNVHTGETLKTVYWADGHYEPGALSRLNHVLRDHYSDQVHRMDPKLIDLLCRLQTKFSGRHALEVYSGYRSPETNAMLAMQSEGVAAHSLHMQGMAADIRIKDVGLRSLKRTAKGLRLGGVGSYHTFVHVDVGRVRYW